MPGMKFGCTTSPTRSNAAYAKHLKNWNSSSAPASDPRRDETSNAIEEHVANGLNRRVRADALPVEVIVQHKSVLRHHEKMTKAALVQFLFAWRRQAIENQFLNA